MTTRALILLGAFELTRDGVPVSRFHSDKVRALLAYLATESDRPHARASLAALHVTWQAIQWLPDAAIVDVTQFTRLARSADADNLARAAALYRREFLAGFSLPGCEAFEEWLLLMREQLQQQALAALHALAELHLAAQRWANAAAVAQRLAAAAWFARHSVQIYDTGCTKSDNWCLAHGCTSPGCCRLVCSSFCSDGCVE